MGRCYRGRAFNKEGYNCYVFNGGEKKCSGVGYVIDKDIFQFSKEALEKIDGKINEEEKIKLIDNLYATERLKETDYYKKILDTLNYIKSLYTNEMDKAKAKKMFRNINSITVIPQNVFINNKDEIEFYKEIINKKRKKDMEEKELEKLKIRKAEARAKLMEYTVSIPFYLVNDRNIENFEINKYERIQIFKCKYDQEKGVVPIKELVQEKEMKEWDNFF